jgi:hypothetical protein
VAKASQHDTGEIEVEYQSSRLAELAGRGMSLRSIVSRMTGGNRGT